MCRKTIIFGKDKSAYDSEGLPQHGRPFRGRQRGPAHGNRPRLGRRRTESDIGTPQRRRSLPGRSHLHPRRPGVRGAGQSGRKPHFRHQFDHLLSRVGAGRRHAPGGRITCRRGKETRSGRKDICPAPTIACRPPKWRSRTRMASGSPPSPARPTQAAVPSPSTRSSRPRLIRCRGPYRRTA